MEKLIRKAFSQGFKLSAAIVLLGSLAACATTSSVNVADYAPITYKVGNQHGTKYASLNARSMPGQFHGYRQTEPRRYTPPPVSPSYTMPTPIPARPVYTDDFDMASVDPKLHPHQKVGKRYRYKGKSYTPKHEPRYDVVGSASWYGDKFHGKPTASGEKFNKNELTAAHKTLPLNSMLRVTNLETGKAIMVRLNDRGPFIGDRIIDLSESAALELGTYSNGLAMVRVQYAGPANSVYSPPPVPSHPYVPPVTEPEAMVAEVPDYVPSAPPHSDPSSSTLSPRHELAEPSYSPLRDQADLSAQNGEVSIKTQPFIPPVHTVPYEADSAEMSAQAPYIDGPAEETFMESEAAAIPQNIPEARGLSDYDPEVDGGTVTLTIKGPIHMAKSETVSGQNSQKPRVIPVKYEQRIYNN